MDSLPKAPAPDDFEQQVQQCLAALYDFGKLQAVPLVDQLAPDLNGVARVQQARKVLIQTIEDLNLVSDDDTSRSGRAYNILYLRYVEEQPPLDVMRQLSLSERQYYRDQRRAIQALSLILWESVQAVPHASGTSDATVPSAGTRPHEISLHSEMERLRSHEDYGIIALNDLLRGIDYAATGLATQRGIYWECVAPSDFVPIYANRSILRQSLLWLASQSLLGLSAGPDAGLRLSCVLNDQVVSFLYEASNAAVVAAAEGWKSTSPLSEFLATLEAVLYCDAANARIQLDLPRRQKTILIVDDNPDFINLIKRFLISLPIEVLSTSKSIEVFDLAQRVRPSVIILDLMLPGSDGWEILQRIKTHQGMQSIPIYVCSVLETPELALSLGAAGFLKKPPEQAQIMALLAEIPPETPV